MFRFEADFSEYLLVSDQQILYTFSIVCYTVLRIDSRFILLGLQRVFCVGEEWYLSQEQEERNNF